MNGAKARYSHILEPDRTLFQIYIDSHVYNYVHLDFDVRVGTGRDPGSAFSDDIRRMAIHLSQRRIDCVAHTLDRIHIIEVTFSAGLTSLGQLMAYPSLYKASYRPSLPIVPVLVCHDFQTDAQSHFDANGITYHLIDMPS
jgi:hypothetical protein